MIDKKQRLFKLNNVLNRPQCRSKLLTFLDQFGILAMDLATMREDKWMDSLLKCYEEIMDEVGVLQTKVEHFETIKELGNGAYGSVLLVKHKFSQEKYAMKCISKSFLEAETIFQEREIMMLNNPWLVQLYSTFQDQHHLYMLMEYMPGGDLSNYCVMGGMPEDWVRFYAAEIVLGLEGLHSLGHLHRDVKPLNILINGNGHLKLADFGTAGKMNEYGLAYYDSYIGTAGYAAPEVINCDDKPGFYGSECDWWSFGVTLYELLTGDMPFDSESSSEMNEVLNYKYIFPEDVEMSEEAKSLIKALLTDRRSRIGVEDIKNHPFFLNNQWTFQTIKDTVAPLKDIIVTDSDEMDSDCKKSSKIKPFKGNQRGFVGFSCVLEEQLLIDEKNLPEHLMSAGGEPTPEALKHEHTSNNEPQKSTEQKTHQAMKELELKLQELLTSDTQEIERLREVCSSMANQLKQVQTELLIMRESFQQYMKAVELKQQTQHASNMENMVRLPKICSRLTIQEKVQKELQMLRKKQQLYETQLEKQTLLTNQTVNKLYEVMSSRKEKKKSKKLNFFRRWKRKKCMSHFSINRTEVPS